MFLNFVFYIYVVEKCRLNISEVFQHLRHFYIYVRVPACRLFNSFFTLDSPPNDASYPTAQSAPFLSFSSLSPPRSPIPIMHLEAHLKLSRTVWMMKVAQSSESLRSFGKDACHRWTLWLETEEREHGSEMQQELMVQTRRDTFIFLMENFYLVEESRSCSLLTCKTELHLLLNCNVYFVLFHLLVHETVTGFLLARSFPYLVFSWRPSMSWSNHLVVKVNASLFF